MSNLERRHSAPANNARHSERSEESPLSDRRSDNSNDAPGIPIASHGLLPRLRARLQPGRNTPQRNGALAPEVRPLSRATNIFRSRIFQTAIICCLAIVMLGADNTASKLDKRYDRIGHNMMCACGCGQILLECNHVGCPDSARMDKELRTMVDGGSVGGSGNTIATGGSDKDILNWFVEKYGATVLASPIRGGFDNVAWIMPISVFLVAILGTALLARLWKARTAQRVPLKIKGMTASSTEELRERIRRETYY